jgi:hypothetical protein
LAGCVCQNTVRKNSRTETNGKSLRSEEFVSQPEILSLSG